MSDATGTGGRCGRVRATVTAIGCLLRGLPLVLREAPRTPLRVLCIVALDTLHVLRDARPMPRQKIDALARFLDFQAGTNAAWDRKPLCEADHRAIRRRLEAAGLGFWIAAYVDRLQELETRRPPVGGDRRYFDQARSYRENVVRVSLAAVTGIALDAGCFEEALQATRCDGNVETLFRIAMQCQIIDDVLDYGQDLSAGLPSFLTACASLPLAVSLTAETARSYAAPRRRSPGDVVFPVRMAVRVVSAVATLVVACHPARKRIR